MANWAKVDALLPMNPKAMEAGFWGTTVFVHLILLNRAHGHDGVIPGAYAAPVYLARYLGMVGEVQGAAAVVAEALRAAERAGLILLLPEGVRLCGWDDSWDYMPSTSREAVRKRVAKHRARRKQEQAEQAALESEDEPETDGVTESVTVTGNVTVTENLTRRREEKRREEITQESRNDPGRDAGEPEAPAQAAEEPKAKAKRKPREPKQIPEQAHLIAQLLADSIAEHTPEATIAKMAPAARAKRLEQWANVVRLMQEQDGHTWAQIQAMVDWCQRDNFWRGVVASAQGLRNNWDTMAGQRASGRGNISAQRQGRAEPAPHGQHGTGEQQL